MATPAQIAANRRNAQLSTGPRTEAGKARSRMNALQSGLHAESLVIRGEDTAALAQLSAEYHAQLHPCTPRERDLVDTVVHNQWLIRRLRLVEAQLWEFKFAADDETYTGKSAFHERYRRHPLAHVFENLAPRLAYLQSRINSLERSTRRALSELRDLRQSADPSHVGAGYIPPAAPADDEIGFVPQISPVSEASAPPPPGSDYPGPIAVHNKEQCHRSPLTASAAPQDS